MVFAASAADVFGAIQRLRQGESLMELFLLIVLVALVAGTSVANRAGSGGHEMSPRLDDGAWSPLELSMRGNEEMSAWELKKWRLVAR